MSLSQVITRIVDTFYFRPLRALIPLQIFRYGFCGAANMVLDSIWYFLIYHFIIKGRFIDLDFVVVSPHIASLALVFPITFFTGFWLNRNIAFRTTEAKSSGQMAKYALTVVGAIILNYLCMKLFVEVCNIWPTPSKSITTVISAVYSFLAAKYFTFKEKGKGGAAIPCGKSDGMEV